MANKNLSDVIGGGSSRRKTHIIKVSDAALAVPTWATGIIVHGAGAGQGGGNSTTAGNTGNGGSAGGFVMGAYAPLDGATTLAATIGAGGAGSAGSSNASLGSIGGSTTLAFGTRSLTLEGGGLTGGGNRSRAYWGAAFNGATSLAMGTAPWGLSTTTTPAHPFGEGATGSSGTAAPFGTGAHSPFGSGGAGSGTGAPGTDFAGGVGSGYGAGGAGSNGTSAGGAGAPGILIIEFVEGF